MSYSQWMAVFPYAFEHLGTVLGKTPFPKESEFGIQRLNLQCFYKHVFFFVFFSSQTNLPKGAFTMKFCI